MVTEHTIEHPSREQLEAAAREISEKAPEGYRQAVYLYFLARYMVAVYEAKFSQIPIQVWNEYRNALDHFFRHITSHKNEPAPGQLEKMEGHVQRAVLDVIKIYCHDSADDIRAQIKKEDPSCLRLVNNGRFNTALIEAQREAMKCFIYAKTRDNTLGEDANNNLDVVGNYLDAFYKYYDLDEMLGSHRAAIDRITYEAGNLQARAALAALRHAFWEHVVAGITSKTIWAGVVFIGGIVLFFM